MQVFFNSYEILPSFIENGIILQKLAFSFESLQMFAYFRFSLQNLLYFSKIFYYQGCLKNVVGNFIWNLHSLFGSEQKKDPAVSWLSLISDFSLIFLLSLCNLIAFIPEPPSLVSANLQDLETTIMVNVVYQAPFIHLSILKIRAYYFAFSGSALLKERRRESSFDESS